MGTKVLAGVGFSGRSGDGMVTLFKMAVALATKEGRNANGQFANRRRICIVAEMGYDLPSAVCAVQVAVCAS